jgi:D-sedoheptulose 7-phosphate isomerase
MKKKKINISEVYFAKLKNCIDFLDFGQIDDAIHLIEKKWIGGNQIVVIGNGGSSLTALHYINDWSKSVYLSTGRPLYGRTLTDNIGLVMSYANDLSFDDVFVEQLKTVIKQDDLLIAISGSGNSENIIRAVDYANQIGVTTLGVCGYQGGRLRQVAQSYICSKIDDMQISEDFHLIFGHIVMQYLCGAK